MFEFPRHVNAINSSAVWSKKVQTFWTAIIVRIFSLALEPEDHSSGRVIYKPPIRAGLTLQGPGQRPVITTQ